MDKEAKTGGVAKIAEYASRVASGEPLESVLEGLPPGMRQAVEEQAGIETKSQTEKRAADPGVPPQYEGLSSEILDELWTIPIYVDPEMTKSELERKSKVIESLRQKEKEKEITQEDDNVRKADDAEKISKAKAALGMEPVHKNRDSSEGLDAVESMSVEDFAAWLATEGKKRGRRIGSGSAYNAITARPEFRHLRIAEAFGDATELMETYRDNKELIRKFTDETEARVARVDGAEYVSGTWDHYKIRYEKKERNETYKGYVTIDRTQVLTDFTPEIRHEIVKRLLDEGYRGQVKFPVTGSRAFFSYDNIVLHGNDQEDVDKGIEIAQAVLSEHAVRYEAARRGVDAEGTDGKKTSYSDRIAQLVEQATKDPNIDVEAEIKKLMQ